MSKDSLTELIEAYPDFPKKGILFRDIMPVLQNSKIFGKLIEDMANLEISKNAEAVLAIDARGFLLGSAIALKLHKPLIVARKPVNCLEIYQRTCNLSMAQILYLFKKSQSNLINRP